MQDEQSAFTCAEVAKAAHISVPMVRKLIRTKKLRPIYIGRCVRIGKDELKRLLDQGVRR